MAKIKNPLLSFDASGNLGDQITYSTRHRRQIVEKIAQPGNVKSLAQLSWRTMYQKAIALWHLLSPDEKREWEAQGTTKHMTGYAYFMSQCLKPNPGIYLPLAGGIMQGPVDMATHAITALPNPSADQDADTKAARNSAIASAIYTQGARVRRTAAQGVNSGASTPIEFTTEVYDTDNIHDNSTNNTRLTCRTPGKYLIIASLEFDANATGERIAMLRKNDTNYISWCRIHGYADIGGSLNVSTIWNMALNDYVECYVNQNSGGSLNVITYSYASPEFMMQRIG